MTLGEKIKSLRNELQLSQRELAKELSVFYTVISKWELNQVMPNIFQIVDICKFFKISLDEFMEDVKRK